MKSDQFASQQRDAGYRVERFCGYWWQNTGPFFWKPAVPYQQIVPGKSRPPYWRSLVGFSHAVPRDENSNISWPVLMLRWTEGEEYSLQSVHSKRRNQIRKGLKCNRIERLTELDPHFDDLKEINITTRLRTGVGKRPEYYEEKNDEWRSFLTRHFRLDDREWWGAFDGEKLIGYYYAYAIDDLLVIDTAKSHTDFLSNNPNDGILFTLLQHAINRKGCRRIIYGGYAPDDQGLTHFKKQHGFEVVDIPAFRWLSLPARMLVATRKVV